jgi:hypothetical protein
MKSNTNERSWVMKIWKSSVCSNHIEKRSKVVFSLSFKE